MRDIADTHLKVLGSVVSYEFKALGKIEPQYSSGAFLNYELLYEVEFENDSADITFYLIYSDHNILMQHYLVSPHSDEYRQLLEKELDNVGRYM